MAGPPSTALILIDPPPIAHWGQVQEAQATDLDDTPCHPPSGATSSIRLMISSHLVFVLLQRRGLYPGHLLS